MMRRASLFVGLLSMGVAGTVTAAPVNFHPGHYYYIGAPPELLASPDTWKDVLLAHPNLKGAHLQYSWKGLENADGTAYTFTKLKSDLNWLADHNKYLVIQFQTKSFVQNVYYFPNYIRNGGYYFKAASNPPVVGYNVKWWEPYVRDRVKALITALNNRLTAREKSALEGFWINEMAGEIVGTDTLNNHKDAIISNMVNVLSHARNTLNVLSGQYTNRWTSIHDPDTFDAYVPAKIGIGHNILPKDIYTTSADSSKNTFLGIKAAAYPGVPAATIPSGIAETHVLESPQGTIYRGYPYKGAADVIDTLKPMGAHYVNWKEGGNRTFNFDDIMTIIDGDEFIAINTTRPKSLGGALNTSPPSGALGRHPTGSDHRDPDVGDHR